VVLSGIQTVGNLVNLNVTGNVAIRGNALVVNTVTNRVGLGTSTPGYSLDIVGDISAKTYRQNNNVVWGSSSPTFDTFQSSNYLPENTVATSIAGLIGTTKWAGGVLAPNGKIYGIPTNSTSVLIINPATNTADTTTITGLSGSDNWIGGVLAPNGKIYGILTNSTSVLIIDPVTDSADTTTIFGLSGFGNGMAGSWPPMVRFMGFLPLVLRC
jgi:hypothetical protein